MKNITLSLDDELLARIRAYASAHETTVNQLVRESLEKIVRAEPAAELEEAFAWSDLRQLRSTDGPLTREQAHER